MQISETIAGKTLWHVVFLERFLVACLTLQTARFFPNQIEN